MTNAYTPVPSAVWIQDSQAFMHDQFQAVKDHFIATARESETRLQVYFTVMVGIISALALVPDKYPWMETVLPIALLLIGFYTYKSSIFYTWSRYRLAAELDVWTVRWTCGRNSDECFLLLGDLWTKAETEKHPTALVLKTRRDRIKFVFQWKEYYHFIFTVPHAAIIAGVNALCCGDIAFQLLSSALPDQIAKAVMGMVVLVVWCAQAIHYRGGIVFVESDLKERFRRVRAEVEAQAKCLESEADGTTTTSASSPSARLEPQPS